MDAEVLVRFAKGVAADYAAEKLRQEAQTRVQTSQWSKKHPEWVARHAEISNRTPEERKAAVSAGRKRIPAEKTAVPIRADSGTLPEARARWWHVRSRKRQNALSKADVVVPQAVERHIRANNPSERHEALLEEHKEYYRKEKDIRQAEARALKSPSQVDPAEQRPTKAQSQKLLARKRRKAPRRRKVLVYPQNTSTKTAPPSQHGEAMMRRYHEHKAAADARDAQKATAVAKAVGPRPHSERFPELYADTPEAREKRKKIVAEGGYIENLEQTRRLKEKAALAAQHDKERLAFPIPKEGPPWHTPEQRRDEAYRQHRRRLDNPQEEEARQNKAKHHAETLARMDAKAAGDKERISRNNAKAKKLQAQGKWHKGPPPVPMRKRPSTHINSPWNDSRGNIVAKSIRLLGKSDRKMLTRSA